MSLLNLPQELRNEIYNDLFPSGTSITFTVNGCYTPNEQLQYLELGLFALHPYLSILHVCSQLRQEILSTLADNIYGILVITTAINFAKLPSTVMAMTKELYFKALPMDGTDPRHYASRFPRIVRIIAGTVINGMLDALYDFYEEGEGLFNSREEGCKRVAEHYFAKYFNSSQLYYPERFRTVGEVVSILTPVNLQELHHMPPVLIKARFINTRVAHTYLYCSGISAEYDVAARKVVRTAPAYFYRDKRVAPMLGLGPRGIRLPEAWIEFGLNQDQELKELLCEAHAKKSLKADGNTIAGAIPPGINLGWEPLEKTSRLWCRHPPVATQVS
ncbi:hypothetical protein PMZ80_006125 [Knufia obscura]|uniref:F-box domain-containing protein n=1 Tax=Knufia obscura TaxID=1635080 RepID=A0ABR0RPE3_9EURO|nr:hypothetical protein PMZ80_006125 [Knufia obscura]